MAYLNPTKKARSICRRSVPLRKKVKKLICLTAYDYPTARIVDEAGVDIILVGDSMETSFNGYGNTIPVTLEEDRLQPAVASRWATERAMVVADMPFAPIT